jgi:magnesium-transporting ATPase (P-type)
MIYENRLVDSYPPPPPSSSGSQPPPPPTDEIAALEDIKSFSLLGIIATLILGVGLFAVFFSGFTSVLSSPHVGLFAAIGTVILAIIVIVIGAIIYLIALFKLRSGYMKIRNIDPSFGISYTGTTLILIGLILLIIGAILTLVIVGIFLVIIGAILLFIGEILALIVGAFKLNGRYNETLFLVAGILFIIGIFISIFTFIGMILFYIATNNVLNRLRKT